MDLEDRKKRQTLKVLLAESLMVVSVLITVVILVLVVSGYWIDSDFEIQRFGLLRIDSEPTGATVMIDGAEMSKTNFSKVISSIEHEIVLKKDGYDSWSKTVKISEGLLYQLRYPRLFLQDRVKESVLGFSNASFVSVAPNHNGMLIIEDGTKWEFINLKEEKLVKTALDTLIFDENTPFEVIKAEWSLSGRKVLLQGLANGEKNWVYIDLDNNKNNFNITKKFETCFTRISFINNSNELLVYDGATVRRMDLANKVLTDTLIKNVIDYYPSIDNSIVFVAEEEGKYSVNYYKKNQEIAKLTDLDERARIAVTPFYGDHYLIVFTSKEISIYKGEELEPILKKEAAIDLTDLRIMDGEGFVVARDGNNINAIDMEAMQLSIWNAEANMIGWIDNYLIYTINGGVLSVYDFDGQNGRQLSGNVSENLPATITDDKWLYYFSNNALVREWLIKK